MDGGVYGSVGVCPLVSAVVKAKVFIIKHSSDKRVLGCVYVCGLWHLLAGCVYVCVQRAGGKKGALRG